MRVFVTGATGFVGGHLAAALAARGDEVTALVRRPQAAAELAAAGAVPVFGSLEEADALRRAVVDVEVVCHLAGLIAARSEAEFMAVNVEGTRRLVAAARDAAPRLRRLVFVSSQAALGPTAPGHPLDETATPAPISAYGRSKLAAEAVVRASHLPWTIVRPPAVYGPRDREFLRLFRLVRRGIAPVFGLGRQELSLLFAPDLAEGILAAGTVAGAAGQTYHLAHREVVTARDFARAVAHALGRRAFVLPVPPAVAAPIVRAIGRASAARGRPSAVNADKLAEFLAPAWTLSTDKAERELGWRATHDLAAGLRATAEWYRSAGWLR